MAYPKRYSIERSLRVPLKLDRAIAKHADDNCGQNLSQAYRAVLLAGAEALGILSLPEAPTPTPQP